MIVYVRFYEGKDVKLDVSCFGVVVREAQSSLQDSRKLMAILLSVEDKTHRRPCKMSSSKKLTLKGTFVADVYQSL